MAVMVYKSSDPDAPVLSGQNGALTTLLDKCLVTGYGEGGTAKAGAGWEIVFTDVDRRVYRSADDLSTQCCLHVDDVSAHAQRFDGRQALIWAYHRMTDIDSGTLRFPTDPQLGGVAKSTSQNSSARVWTLIADSRFFYLFIATGSASSFGGVTLFVFGDVVPTNPMDEKHCLIRTEHYQSSLSTNWGFHSGPFSGAGRGDAGLTTVGSPKFNRVFCTSPDQFSASGSFVLGSTVVGGSNVFGGPSGLQYPHTMDGGLLIAPVYAIADGVIRGKIPGFFNPLHDQPVSQYDLVPGGDVLPGRELMAMNCGPYLDGVFGQVLFDVTGPWR